MNYAQLGYRIRQMRICKHITQKQIAKQLNFSQQHIANVERGIVRPSIDLLVEISNIFNVSVDYLLQDSLHRAYLGKTTSVLPDIQYFLDQQESVIQEMQKMLQNL